MVTDAWLGLLPRWRPSSPSCNCPNAMELPKFPHDTSNIFRRNLQTFYTKFTKLFHETTKPFSHHFYMMKLKLRRVFSEKSVLTTSGVLAPSVCDVESALLLVPPSPFVEPPNSGGLPPSLSSITKSMGILPFRQLMYLWQKLSQSSCTWNKKILCKNPICG